MIPLRPEPSVQPAGPGKNAGARHAAKRFVATLRQDHPPRKCIVTADRLRAHAPPTETLPDHAVPSLLGVTAGEHALLCPPVQVAAPAGRVTDDERPDRAAGVVHRCRCVTDRPLHASTPPVRVNVIEAGALGQHQVQHLSGVTDLRLRPRHVYHLRRGGRARWKLEHATCTTRKNQGDPVEPTYGHGEPPLAVVCARLMMLACWVDQAQPRGCALFPAVWAKLGSHRLLGERMRALCEDDAVQSMRQRLEPLLYGVTKRPPLLAVDSSGGPARLWYGPPPKNP